MINQFWNLCRACPSVNIDKLHSEYSSTYRWHEYTPQNQNEVIRKPPTSQGETRPAAGLRSGMGRRRIDWIPAPGGAGSGMQDGGDGDHPVRVSQSEERSRRFLRPSHRSRSEGPLGRDIDDDSFLVSEYKTQYAWVRRGASAKGPEAAPLLEAEKYRAKRPKPAVGPKSNTMKSLLTWPNTRQPPPHSTRIHVNVNGTAGGISSSGGGGTKDSDEGGTGTAQQHPAAGQQTTPRTPRKSKSMGRIHGGGGGGGGTGTEVGGGGGGGGGEGGVSGSLPHAAGGSSAHSHSHHHHHHNQHHNNQQPQGGAANPEGQQLEQQQTSSAAPAAAAAASASATRTEAPATSNWHRGHRRVPSDGVAWRVSKGLEADRIIGGENMMVSGDDKVSKRILKRSTTVSAIQFDPTKPLRAYKSEYRKKFRPFSQYQYVDGKFHKVKTDEPAAGADTGSNNWYKEVIELRRQAGQYRARHDIGDVWRTVQHRGWGVETASERLAEIYTKQAELWEQVSRRSSLQALSLAAASPSRPISKAEKDIENSRRSSPIKHVSTSSRERPSTAPPKPKPAAVHTQKTAADKADLKCSKDSTPRHHYERTTGTTEDGLLITSPSRDKIEPFIPDDWSSRRSSRRTPPITSPMKGGRSISVGPENRSPKRTSRPPSTHAAAPTTKPERRPRPTSLSTSARRKGTDALPHRPSSHDESKETKKVSKAKPHEPTASPKKGEDRSKADKKAISEEIEPKKEKDKDSIKDSAKESTPKDGPKEPVEAVKESTGRKSTPEPRFDPEKYEPVVKTPPEPTRVKSPDQVMVKSPDPVNWTVPLDTGKTFTVTHNIPEGESARGTPSSEHRHVLDSRTRQTPEPTKLTQGPLVGTPLSSITSDAKSYTQEQPKPATATTVEPKVDDKPVEKKPEPSKTAEPKAVEPKVTESKVPEAKPLDIKAPEPKLDTKVPDTKVPDTKVPDTKVPDTKVPDTKVPDTKPLDTKVESKPSESKIPEVKPFDTKVESKLGDVKAPEVKPFDTKIDPKASETKTDVKPCDTKKEPSLSDIKAQEPKSSEPMPQASKPGDIKAPESKISESKGPEPKQPEPSFELKKADPIAELKSTPAQQPHQPLQQVPPSPPAPTQASPTDIVPPSSGAVDPMSMSMFGSLNGMNGKSSGTPSPTKPEVPLPSEPTKEASGPESKPVGVRNIPGSNLRCLDDPSFMFDQPSQGTTNSPKTGAYKVLEAPETSQPKPGGYRVLEAPEAPSDIKDLPDQSPTKPEAPVKPSPYRVLEAPIEPPARPKGSPYRVLEAPDAPYYPQSQTVGAAQESKPPSLVSPSSGRVVTDALDKARTRFDSFWGGSKDKDPPSKV